jgi:energy-coupling factor transporter ATP-binding protein EcfA2
MKVTIANVRTFKRRSEVTLAPLTIVTGENSSGKSTFLALLAALMDPEGFPFRPAFNTAPYSLGNYDSIATYNRGREGRAKTFTIGYEVEEDHRQHGPARLVEATYSGRAGQVTLASVELRTPHARIRLVIGDTDERRLKGRVTVSQAGVHDAFAVSIPRRVSDKGAINLGDLLLYSRAMTRAKDRVKAMRVYEVMESAGWFRTPQRATSLAPIRSRPERTYNAPSEAYDPEGGHVPSMLDRLLGERSKQGEYLRGVLNSFGKESGLFDAVKVRRLGRNAGDPFQLSLLMNGPARNLIDVGYGVSQALPVVVQTALAARNEMVLIQQPEVHLHPRAQAALGSLFCGLVRSGHSQIVAETHSDYIIDRVRQEVANGTITSSDVALLYFDRSRFATRIHQLGIDDLGNVLRAPKGYRRFFLEEEDRLMSRGASSAEG